MEQKGVSVYPDVLEKAQKVAAALVAQGARAVILSGSAAKGKENPGDLDFAVFFSARMLSKPMGKRRQQWEQLRHLEKDYSLALGIPIQVFWFSEEYVDWLVKEYNKSSFVLAVRLVGRAKEFSGRSDSWPLIPLLSPKQFDDFFGDLFGYRGSHPYITKEYVILGGEDWIKKKRRKLSKDPSS